MTVGELIRELSQFQQDTLVTRADTDWGGIDVTAVSEAIYRSVRNGNIGIYWEEEYPELSDPNEDGPLIKAIKIK